MSQILDHEPVSGSPLERFIAIMSLQEIQHFWPEIEAALDSDPTLWDTITKDFLKEQAVVGGIQFWSLGHVGHKIDLFLITQFHTMVSGKKEFHVLWLYGEELDEYWSLMMATVERVALQLGCSEIVVKTVRRGLEKKLRPEGFRLRSVELVRSLGAERIH